MPGSIGEHRLQQRYGTVPRARGFYDHQVLDHLNGHMQTFIGRMEMAFVATADGSGEADCSFRAGPPGFVRALGERTLVYPEYRGNGVMASLATSSRTHTSGCSSSTSRATRSVCTSTAGPPSSRTTSYWRLCRCSTS